MQKTHQIVIIKSKDKSKLGLLDNDLYFLDEDECSNYAHIYVLSDNGIEINVDNDSNLFQVTEQNYSGILKSINNTFIEQFCKKVIATTDKYMVEKSKGLGVYDKIWNKPKIKLIPNSFLPKFVDAWNRNKISEIELDYDGDGDVLKTNENNEVFISLNKEIVIDNLQLATEQFNRAADRNKKDGMNIIEAIQQAENGFAITNNFLKIEDAFLIYIKNGFFSKYVLFDGEPLYINTFDTFTTAQILCKSWEVLPENYRNKIFKNN